MAELRFTLSNRLGTRAGNADGMRGVVGDDAREKEGITPDCLYSLSRKRTTRRSRSSSTRLRRTPHR